MSKTKTDPRTDPADKMAELWGRYDRWRKGWGVTKTPTVEGFAEWLHHHHFDLWADRRR